MKTHLAATLLLSRRETAELLGIKPQTLATWQVTGKYGLPCVKVAGPVGSYQGGHSGDGEGILLPRGPGWTDAALVAHESELLSG